MSPETSKMPSQFGQDLFVLEVLGGMRGGFFLDSGAADGMMVSNTLLLETSFGWNGICIEPNEALFSALVRNRRCCCLNCCLYNRAGIVDFLEDACGMGGILTEYHPDHLQYAKNSFRAGGRKLPEDANGRPITVPKVARTVRSVLQECNAPSVIDYWSLDTEGSEFAILKSFPFDEYSFRVLTIEHNWKPVRNQIKAFLQSRDYLLVRELEIDDCYVKDVSPPLAPWRSSAWTLWQRGRALR
jgi:hypothetical protein